MCPRRQQLLLFSQDSDLLDSNISSSDRRVSCCSTTHSFQSGQFSADQLNLIIEKSVLVDRTHPLQSGQSHGGQHLTIFTQEVDLVTMIHPLYCQKCPGVQHLNLFRYDSALLDSISSSSGKRVSWRTATRDLYSGQGPVGHQISLLFQDCNLYVNNAPSSVRTFF
jgi:hypothetical protein